MMKIRSIAVIVFTLLLHQSLIAQKAVVAKESSPLIIGEKIKIHSDILKEDRVLNIYLPQSYSVDSTKTYPVIYLLDGSIDEDFIHIAGIVQFGSFPWIEMVPESIVVGIANTDRRRDFTFPTSVEKDKEDFPESGKSADFISFLKKELFPFVETNYRADSVSTIIGQSLGGLLATEILYKAPHMFDNYVIVSPSLWWDNESLLELQPEPFQHKKSIYVAVGKEGEIMERTAKDLYLKLSQHKEGSTDLFFEFFADKTHGDALHLAAYTAFERIFKKDSETKE